MIKEEEKYIFDCYIELTKFDIEWLHIGVIYFHEDDISDMLWEIYEINYNEHYHLLLNSLLHNLYDEIIIDLVVDKMIENKKEELNEQNID